MKNGGERTASKSKPWQCLHAGVGFRGMCERVRQLGDGFGNSIRWGRARESRSADTERSLGTAGLGYAPCALARRISGNPVRLWLWILDPSLGPAPRA